MNTPEIPRLNGQLTSILDRTAEGVVTIGEHRLTQIVAFLQLPIYLDFIHRGVREGMPWWGAALHPILTRLGGADAMFSNPNSLNQILFTAELMELTTVGTVAALTVGTAIGIRVVEHIRGEIPIDDPDAVIFLSAGLTEPVAEPFGALLQTKVEGRPHNVYFATFYSKGTEKPKKPGAGFSRRYFAQAVDMKSDITSTANVQKAGALRAPVIILAGPTDRVIEEIATSIQSNRKDPARIIPFCTTPTSFEPYTTIDQETEELVTLTEAPINPFGYFSKIVSDLVSLDRKVCNNAAEQLTRGIPNVPHSKLGRSVREIRRERILTKTEKMKGSEVKIFLDGEEGVEKQALREAFGSDRVTETVEKAEIIISFGKSDLKDDLSVSAAAEKMKEQRYKCGSSLKDKLHLFLTFHQDNEDSASVHAEAGASIQRLIAEELVERTKENVLVISHGIVTRAIRGIRGGLIREKINKGGNKE